MASHSVRAHTEEILLFCEESIRQMFVIIIKETANLSGIRNFLKNIMGQRTSVCECQLHLEFFINIR